MTSVVKQDAHKPAGFFEAEAAGLRWLADAGGARVVQVLDVQPGCIELERIFQAQPTREAAAEFGAALARTHAAGADAFGAPPDGWEGPLFIGRRELPRVTDDSWGAFYARARVEPYLATAVANRHLTGQEEALVRRACDAVSTGEFDDAAPPARIHGDLWAGNLLFGTHGAVLIDPAAHGGHAETDLAMLALFGAPHLDAIVGAYEQEGSLTAGWRERVPVHQLHPLAVHAAGHGRGYGVALADAARATLDLVG
ncbi:MAG: fructosamine kinase family protein [Demequina sp.]